jgi:hypothetical protein
LSSDGVDNFLSFGNKAKYILLCLQRVRGVDYLLIAILVAVRTLGNPP